MCRRTGKYDLPRLFGLVGGCLGEFLAVMECVVDGAGGSCRELSQSVDVANSTR